MSVSTEAVIIRWTLYLFIFSYKCLVDDMRLNGVNEISHYLSFLIATVIPFYVIARSAQLKKNNPIQVR